MKETILCDLDSVVADLFTPWLGAYNREYGRSVAVKDIHCWDMHKCVPDGAAIYPIIDRPGFFLDLPLLAGASDGLKTMLDQRHEVFIVSAGSEGALADKSKWVRNHLPFMKNRVFFTDGKTPKGLIHGTVMIDDGPHNLLDFKRRNSAGIAIAADYPYTAPAHHICDLIVPFHEDPAAGWKTITDYTGALRG